MWELVDRQQFDRVDAEVGEVRNLVDEVEEAAALAGAAAAEGADVELVDDQVTELRRAEAGVAIKPAAATAKIRCLRMGSFLYEARDKADEGINDQRPVGVALVRRNEDLGSRTLDQADDGTLYVRLPLEPHQGVILA